MRLRRQKLLWVGVAVLMYLAWNRWWSAYSLSASRSGFSLTHISGAFYSTPYWLSYAFWQLPVDTVSNVLCLSAIGALWAMDDLNSSMVIEHAVRYRFFPIRLILQRLGSVLLFCVLVQFGYVVLAGFLQVVVHGSLAVNVGAAIPQIALSAIFDAVYCFGGLVFMYLWRQVAGGVLTVFVLWWVWSNVIELSIQRWFQTLPHWLCYGIMAIFPEPNLYVMRFSSSLWELRLVGDGAYLPIGTQGTPLPGIPYGVNHGTNHLTLYSPSNEVAILTMLCEALLLLLVTNWAVKVWTSRVILQQNQMRTHVLQPRRVFLLACIGALAGTALWIYVIAPFLSNNSSRQLTIKAQEIAAEAAASERIRDSTIVIHAPAGSVTLGDVYLESIFSYSPSYNMDQAILRGNTSATAASSALSDGYRALLDYTRECAGFAQIHPEAWKQIVATANKKPAQEMGKTLNFHTALVGALGSRRIYLPRMHVLAQGVGDWIMSRLDTQVPGSSIPITNKRDGIFEAQVSYFIAHGSRVVNSLSWAQVQKEMW